VDPLSIWLWGVGVGVEVSGLVAAVAAGTAVLLLANLQAAVQVLNQKRRSQQRLMP